MGDPAGVAELPPEPGSTSDAGWFHDLMLRITAARNAGDTAEVDRLRDYGGAGAVSDEQRYTLDEARSCALRLS